MKQRLRLDGVDFDVESLSLQARQILERLRFVEQRLQEMHNHHPKSIHRLPPARLSGRRL